jgi:tRNA pseudouridine55 synthase
MDGLLLINKPTGISSFDVIRILRRTTGVRKIGHTGTLDPAASGLMLMLFGTACKKADQFSKLDKTYVAEVTLGANSTTGDREGELTRVSDRKPTLEEIEAAIKGFIGQITQTPSIYSAIKINGQEAYKLARKGQTPEMPSRQVTIHSIKVLSYEYPKLSLEVDCSSGTYIRTLAEDLGAKLDTGAYLSALERTGVGDYLIDQAIELDTDTQEIARNLTII